MFVRLGPAGRKKKSLSLSVSLNVGLSANPPPPHTLDNVGEFFRAGNSLFRSLLFCSKSLIFHIFHVFDSFSQISPFFKPKSKSLFIKSESERIAHVALYKRAIGYFSPANRSFAHKKRAISSKNWWANSEPWISWRNCAVVETSMYLKQLNKI